MNFRRSGGFALPTVLIASIVMLTVLLVAVTSTAAIRVALVSQYYNQLAQTAGDAGAAYAKACLTANNGKPLWGNGTAYTAGGPLMPDTNCDGTRLTSPSCPASPATAPCHAVFCLVNPVTSVCDGTNSNIFTTFKVGLPQLDSNGLAVNVASIGVTKLIRSSDLASGVVTAWRQYNQTSNLIIASSPTVTMYAWGGGGAGGTFGGWTYGSNGGAGGAAQGMMNMSSGIYPVVVGGAGTINSYSTTFSCAVGGGGCGSNSNSDNRYGGGGGGYSGIFMSSISQSNALLIAGGGGGGGSVWSTNGTTSSTSGGAGGGTAGQMGYGDVDTASYKGQPGTQAAAGATASGTYLNISGTAGANIQGALQGGTTISNSWGGGGGGGYWGGSAGGYYSGGPVFPVNQMTGGGGGSGYFNSTYVSSGLLSSGSGTTPGNSSSSLRGTSGNGGGYQSNGNNGVVIISYPTGSMTATGGYVTTSGGNTFHTFTSSDNFIVGAAQRASCSAIYSAGESTGSGVYWVYPPGSSGFKVYCDMTNDGGGWTLVLQNNSTITTPSPIWNDAINGNNVSGTVNSDLSTFDVLVGLGYWNNLGTNLRAQVGSSPSVISHKATYTFNLDSLANYTIHLSNQNILSGGNAPGLYYSHNGAPFTTSDADHDQNSGNCASYYGNHPWWYTSCWDGNFFAGGSGYQEAPYWTSSIADYYAYGSIWVK